MALARSNLAFRVLWGSMIVAAYQAESIDRLYSVDFDSYSKIGSLQIINPFKP